MGTAQDLAYAEGVGQADAEEPLPEHRDEGEGHKCTTDLRSSRSVVLAGPSVHPLIGGRDRAGKAMMTALDEGKPVEEAHTALHGRDLTGCMAGAAICSRVPFASQRGRRAVVVE